jgi:predicted ATPase/class 3 adenylate cyclase
VERISQPKGTVAFLFTDIEESTRRWEVHPETMGEAVRQHDLLLRKLITEHRGYVFKTVGDAFCATFQRATDAAAAAVDIQRALAQHDFATVGGLPVRVAIHVGEAEERDDDYFGPTVNRVARLLGTAHGGQILLSEATHNLVRDRLPFDTSTTFLGEHNLNDLATPERVFQLAGRGLRGTFPALRGAQSRTTTLPEESTPFIGRTAVVREVEGLLEGSRLLTLVGAGGIGKTRVAVHLARQAILRGSCVWFVELSSLADGQLVGNVVASSMGLRDQGELPQMVITRALQEQPSLLILDNCEHLLCDVAAFCEALLRASGAVRILTTTRERLRVTGEQVYQMPTLELPAADESQTAERALRCESVALFAARAKAINNQFNVTDQAATLIAKIVARLDGIPFAIELAAAATRTLSLRDLLEKLEQQFSVAMDGSRTAEPRQRTMHALIDWSYALLSNSERILFRRVGVFAGTWSLAAADAVCTGSSVPKAQLFALVASLVDKSLVVADTSGDTARYRMLTPVRDYARLRLSRSKEVSVIERSHYQQMVSVADRAFRLRGEMKLSQWLRELEPQIDDLRAALEKCAREGDLLGIAWIAGSLASFWFTTGRITEGRTWIERARPESLDESGFDAEVVARLALGRARIGGPGDPFEQATKAKNLFERLQNDDGLARAYHILAWHLRARGRSEEALVAAEHGLDLWAKIGRGSSLDHAFLMDIHATILVSLGRYDDARAEYAQVLNVFALHEDTEGLSVTRFNQAELAFTQGQVDEAISLARGAAVDLRLMESHSREALALANLTGYYIAADKFSDALDTIARALSLEVRYRAGTAIFTLDHLAAVFAARGLYREASTLAAYVDSRYRAMGAKRDITEQRSRDTVEIFLDNRSMMTQTADAQELAAEMSEESALDSAVAAVAALRESGIAGILLRDASQQRSN